MVQRAVAVGVVVAAAFTAGMLTPTAGDVDPHPAAVAGLGARSEQFPPLWVTQHSSEYGAPYRLADPHVTVELTDDLARWFDEDAVSDGVTAFNDVDGSAFHVDIVDDGGDIVIDGQPDCRIDGKSGGGVTSYDDTQTDWDRNVHWVLGADIELCGGLADRDPDYQMYAAAHEIGHVLGLGHLDAADCDGCTDAHRCAVMAPQLQACTRVTAGERHAAAQLYPDVDDREGDDTTHELDHDHGDMPEETDGLIGPQP